MHVRLGLLVLLAAAPAAIATPGPVRIDLGTLVHKNDETLTAGRDGIRVDARGVDVRFRVPAGAPPDLSVDVYTPGKGGAPAPVHVRLVAEPSNKLVVESDKECWTGIDDNVCRLYLNAGAAPGTFRAELRAPRPINASLAATVFDPEER